ncbi:hypothetical protein EV648_104431 [Kribbella sp. VKM Ac-2568]|nr:hypothetical protein EV648_104431 [Kribbella sp. VKM Ac-2568]
MFECDVDELSAAETLASAARLHAMKLEIEVDLLRLAQRFADLHPDPAMISGRETVPGGERGLVYGGPGCPGVAEFAPAEFGAVIGRSKGSAAALMGQALALRHRLPRIWAQVESQHATAWKACTIATACLHLSVEAAAIVDRKVAGIVDSIPPLRLSNIVRAALWQADPEAARAAAETKAKERGVWAGRTDEHGTTTVFVKAATGDVIHFNATVRQIADALAELGDTDTLDQRRAKAIGIIADPELTWELLAVAQHLTNTGRSSQPTDVAATPPTGTRPAAPADFDDEADRDRPHPSDAQPGRGMDEAARRKLAGRLAAIKQAAYNTDKIGATRRKPAQTTLYVHVTDETLLAGGGVTRVERFGPVYAARLQELLSHDQIIVKPVIDLNDKINVDAYEIPRRIRERVKLTHPVEQFVYGTAETTDSTDLDHIRPFDFRSTGPPGQTSTTNLTPLRRYSHRVKTHGGWRVRRLDDGALEWTTRYGFKFRVDHTGTQPLGDRP